MVRRSLVLLTWACAVAPIAFGETVTATAAAIAVDTRGLSEWYALAGDGVAYAPWYAAEDADLKVRLAEVYLDDVGAAITNEMATYAAGAEGVAALTLGNGVPNRFTLIHEVLDASDGHVVATLSRPVSCGTSGAAAPGVACDTSANPLLRFADAVAVLPLTYSTAWFADLRPASVRIDRIDTRRHGSRIASCTTSCVHQASAPAEGIVSETFDTRFGGSFRFLCTALDAKGEALAEPLEAAVAWKDIWGTALYLK